MLFLLIQENFHCSGDVRQPRAKAGVDLLSFSIVSSEVGVAHGHQKLKPKEMDPAFLVRNSIAATAWLGHVWG